ncbi:MAG: hypothetical protein COA79_14530 [Planctomycetota bacterium]|nr:MAG: hypothetical protein COA79_14530 [Planctomycetota bacterium]
MKPSYSNQLKYSAGFLIIIGLLACVNTTYSRADEKAITGELVHIIMGSFMHHGEAFYDQEVIRNNSILEKNPKSFDAINDLAVAYFKRSSFMSKVEKLAQPFNYHDSIKLFETNEKYHPNRYKTASNMGVMYKKFGDFENAEKYIKKALKIKPQGHMGLGDYYLKMIQYLKSNDGSSNFLGIKYEDGYQKTAEAANKEYVISLIKNDHQFADAYIVLGDILLYEKKYQLALRSYLRYQDLIKNSNGKSDRNFFYMRSESLFELWSINLASGHIFDRYYKNQFHHDLMKVKDWLLTFHNFETTQLQNGNSVSFSHLTKNNMFPERPIYLDIAYFKGTYDWKPIEYVSLIFVILLLVLPAKIYWNLRKGISWNK